MSGDAPRPQVGEAKAEFRYLIRDMPADERPRERLARLGAEALGDAELIAILLRTGTKGMSAVQVAQELVKKFRTLDALARAPLGDVAKVKGVGQTKAIQVKAAFTLARHLRERAHERRPTITTPGDAAELVREEMRLLDRESFRVILLNTKNAFIKTCAVSLGSLNASIVEPREVFKEAISASAAGVILAHNHPSGDPTPSSEDIAITKRLLKAGELLGIAVHDHIILGQRTAGRATDFVSLKEIGLI
jgi:DNA repair protein RadC